MRMLGPGSTLGMLGGGQLGRMFALEARRMGYRVVALEPDPDSPCGQVADAQIEAPYDDARALRRLAEICDAITLEFENVPSATVKSLEAQGKSVRPGSHTLKITQNRLLEKSFAREAGIAVTGFRRVASPGDLEAALVDPGLPAVIKTVSGGYDGKGQWVARTAGHASEALRQARGAELIWERLVPFAKEISVVCARGHDGQTRTFPVAENIHRRNILDSSIVPARIPEESARRARAAAVTLARELGIVGIFCAEFFLLADGSILLNEIAPRPHNSGHYTLDACVCSQFEQQVRTVCGLPLGSTELLRPAVMVNILGAGAGDRLDGVAGLLGEEAVKLHLYGKRNAVDGRKMGHFTVLADDVEDALARAESCRSKLRWTS